MDYITKDEFEAVVKEMKKDIAKVTATLALATLDRAEVLLRYINEKKAHIPADKLQEIKRKVEKIEKLGREIFQDTKGGSNSGQ